MVPRKQGFYSLYTIIRIFLINDYRKFEIHLPGVVVDVAVLVVEILVALVVVVWVVEAVSMIEIRWQLILIFL